MTLHPVSGCPAHPRPHVKGIATHGQTPWWGRGSRLAVGRVVGIKSHCVRFVMVLVMVMVMVSDGDGDGDGDGDFRVNLDSLILASAN